LRDELERRGKEPSKEEKKKLEEELM